MGRKNNIKNDITKPDLGVYLWIKLKQENPVTV